MTQGSSTHSSGPTHASGMEQHGQQTDTAAGKLADELAGPPGGGHGPSPEIGLAKKAARLLREENVAVEDMLRTSPHVKKVKRG